MSGAIKWIKDTILHQDRQSSEKIFSMPKSYSMDYSLCIPANAFTMFGYPFVCMISCVMFPLCEKEVLEFKR